MFGIATRKKNTKLILNSISNLDLDPQKLGFTIMQIHLQIILVSGILLLLAPINQKYICYIIILLVIIYSNIYFNGCIITRIERHLCPNINWLGPHLAVSIIDKLFSQKISNKMGNIIIFILTSLVISIRLFLKKTIFGVFFLASLSPVLLF